MCIVLSSKSCLVNTPSRHFQAQRTTSPKIVSQGVVLLGSHPVALAKSRENVFTYTDMRVPPVSLEETLRHQIIAFLGGLAYHSTGKR